jgi:Domain of unknown function (DUF3846)
VDVITPDGKSKTHEFLKAVGVSNLQEIVGGPITSSLLNSNRVLISNKEAALHCLPPNPKASALAGKPILGTVAVMGTQLFDKMQALQHINK